MYYILWRSSSAWQSTTFGTQWSQVRILSSSPFYWGGSSPGQSACLARRRQRVRLPSSPPLWRCSSAGQSIRFIPGRSRVRLPLAPPNLEFHIHKEEWTYSSVGQSTRLITGRSLVRAQLGPPIRAITQVWLKGLVLKTSRGFTARGGSNPSLPAI